MTGRAPINQPISRESSASPNLIGVRAVIHCVITNVHSSAIQPQSGFN